jgi:CRP-like cAMP-binding protein
MPSESDGLADVPPTLGEMQALHALGHELRQGPPPDLTIRILLADLLLAGGRKEEAGEAFLKLADELASAGLLARAFGVLKKVEELRPGDNEVAERLTNLVLEQQRLFSAAGPIGSPVTPPAVEGVPPAGREAARAPLADILAEFEALLDAPEPVPAPTKTDGAKTRTSRPPKLPPPLPKTREAAPNLDLLDIVEETLRRPLEPAPPAGETLGHRLLAAPLFAELTREEVAAVIRRLRLHSYRPGDILVTEGEVGQNLSILTNGSVRVFVRSPTGRDVQVARLGEGDFFGEVSAISGSRRTATLIASSPCETLELGKEDLDGIARAHPRVRDRLDDAFVQRAGSAAAAVIRAIDITAQGHVRDQADLALATRFGRSWWDPRTRLRLASALIRAGHEDEALPVLAEAASVLLRAGRTSAATFLLKKIEGFHFRDIVEIQLAPLRRALEAARPSGGQETAAAAARSIDPGFRRWLIHAARETLVGRETEAADTSRGTARRRTLAHYGPGLRASPLFESFTDAELLDLVRGLRLVSAEAGGVVLTQGEQGESLFVLVSGAVKIWARDASGRNQRVCQLHEGAFFGEIATLSGRPRSATVTAAEHCVLLEVTRESLASIRKAHPHVGAVLEEQLVSRGGGRGAS